MPDASGIPGIPTINPTISIPISTLVNSPINDLDPIACAEEAVHKILDELQERGVLQQENRMSIEQLLNPVEEENYMVEDISDEDICNAVLGANGSHSIGDENPEDAEDEEITPRPTRREALAAISSLQRYVQDIDTSYAREFETNLVSFGHQTRLGAFKAMQDTKISDFFTRKP